MVSVLLDWLKGRPFLMVWISLVVYICYDTFEFYKDGRQFRYLRNILGLGVCLSRGTATVLNMCCALVLLPLCKKINQILYLVISKSGPRIFFFWLENAKSFHMTVGATIVIFSVIHSCSHFINIWNLSRFHDEFIALHFGYDYYSPLSLLLTQPAITGIIMLMVIIGMGISSMRFIRRQSYNTFWYIHQLYVLFICLLLLHPLSGILKQEVVKDAENISIDTTITNSTVPPVFVPIKSMTFYWMAFPLICFFIDSLWRLIARNTCKVLLRRVEHFPGHVMNLTLRCENQNFNCRSGQYILLQCPNISLIEWHPFTVVKVPTSSRDDFNLWIRVKGDWTVELENKVKKSMLESSKLNLLLDGPFSSPMEEANKSDIAICIAAGVGITPFVSILQSMFDNPRSRYPGRMHLIWIVRYEQEITWLASLVNKTILELINANVPDRLHVQFYVTNIRINVTKSHVVTFHEGEGLKHFISRYDENEKATLLTPNIKRAGFDVRSNINNKSYINETYSVAEQYPLLGCRLMRGRPQWDALFRYWIHLYPGYQLNLFCCGPKKMSTQIRRKCSDLKNNSARTKFTFINEGFS